MLKLNKISLEGYKSIRQCRDLALSNLNVLIGANGSGKSNFLSFFKLLNFEMTGALQEFIGRSGGVPVIVERFSVEYCRPGLRNRVDEPAPSRIRHELV